MRELLWAIPFTPFAGFFLLALMGSRISRNVAAAIGVGTIGISAVLAIVLSISFIASPPPGSFYLQTLWTWINVGGFEPAVGLRLDALSVVMMLVITVVGFLIHLYSTEFMSDEEGYSRFFAYMNLFVGSMLTLVLADNLLLLYLGWEGVGLCSYLLIGFWYKDPSNGYAARKAFVVTRVGDAAMAVGIFLIFNSLGTLQIREMMERAAEQWPSGSAVAVAAASLLLAGALGKSAQLPLQTWLPDAMAGPTPVSALIHAATMVTAGVYLIARTNVLFTLAPVVQSLVAVIGALTLLLSGLSALTQKDIKRVLAYSTISQIGYMFLALGVGAWSAAIFHFMTHAFFKALLFLSAGVVILALDHEHDIFRMGGLRRQLPAAFWTFLIGASALSSLPFVTAGFYSKDLILWMSWSSGKGSPVLWAAGLTGALITSLYSFRVVFLAFFGEAHSAVTKRPGVRMTAPLAVLAFFSISGGFIELPSTLGDLRLFSGFVGTALPAPYVLHDTGTEALFQIIASVVSLTGIFVAYIFFLGKGRYGERLAETRLGSSLGRFWFSGWGFDRFYDTLFVRPFVRTARANKDDFIDLIYSGAAWYSKFFHGILSRTQTGNVRWYAMGIAFGAVVIMGMVIFL